MAILKPRLQLIDTGPVITVMSQNNLVMHLECLLTFRDLKYLLLATIFADPRSYISKISVFTQISQLIHFTLASAKYA